VIAQAIESCVAPTWTRIKKQQSYVTWGEDLRKEKTKKNQLQPAQRQEA
jgi:hypothetical protein